MQEADDLRQESQQVTERAREVLAASTAASARLRTGSGVRARPSSAPYSRYSPLISYTGWQDTSQLENKPKT